MLTVETKRHIDAARQVLVGKVPDPKAQIDQITNALIYKFMDDMDVKSIDAGGKPTFFTSDLEKYSWRKLMNPRTGAQDRLNMYTEALEKFSTAAGLPPLFRDIFRQAFLPYRDPHTLDLFLKEIEFFDYNHSEELGNAFEYLLSIMGSQGDAGQFRTPRHIIDFMVDVIDPDIGDTILDPACGTAGFLISAYNHIVGKHEGKDKKPLTYGEKQKLMDNLEGYDISSDMVKLARVNMYLHGNSQPKIYEYDTLSSQERWDEMFDVIIANPPFMSPKGGITPHKKFGVDATRAEVLFVDYIMSHLKQKGRAGIIVPEGIIFQSGKAYVQLRKALVEDGLLAVVSLPSGVFNPYAGVKTSILIFDNNRAKLSKHIVFAKVEHDGFDLGAQRRPTPDKNDLPTIAKVLLKFRSGDFTKLEQINDYLESEAATRNIGEFSKVIEVNLVERSKIAESGDYNLSASRYIENELLQNTSWPIKELGEVVDISNGSTPSKTNSEFWYKGNVPWFTIEDIRSQGRTIRETAKHITENALNKTSVKLLPKETVLLCCTASVGEYAFTEIELTTNQQFNGLVVKDRKVLLPKFLFWLTSTFKDELERLSGKTSFNFVSVGILKKIKIPLPPIEAQKQIVDELDGYQKIIDGARQVVENYKPTVKIDPAWQRLKIQDVARAEKNAIKAGPFGSALKKEFYTSSGYKIYGQEQVIRHDAHYGDYYIDEKRYKSLESCKIKAGDVLISLVGTYGKLLIIPDDFEPGIINPRLVKISLNNDEINSLYFKIIFESDIMQAQLRDISYGGTMNILNATILKALEIPLPSLKIQQEIVDRVSEEQTLISTNKRLTEIYEQRIKDKIAEVWNIEN